MKYLLILSLAAFTAFAQVDTNTPPNYAVQFYGPGNVQGYPQFWPKNVQNIGTDTNAAAGWSFMTQAQLDDCIATNKVAFEASKTIYLQSAQTSIATSISNLQVSIAAFQGDLPAFRNPNYSFITNWNNLQLGLKYINTNLLHIADVIDRLTPVLTNLYNQSLTK